MKIAYYFYIFEIRGEGHLWWKLGYSKEPIKRVNEWKRDLPDGYEIRLIYHFPGVYEDRYHKGYYILIGRQETYFQRRDGEVRRYFFDRGHTSTPDFKIRLNNNDDEPFTDEGLDFINKSIVTDEYIINICKEFQEHIFETLDPSYCHRLNKTKYEEFLKDMNDINGYLNYNNGRFCNYLNSKYGSVVTNQFVEYCRLLMPDKHDERFEIRKLFVELCKYTVVSDSCKFDILDTYCKIRKNRYSESIINEIENWLNNEIINYGEPSLF